jgi:hypothetical protein
MNKWYFLCLISFCFFSLQLSSQRYSSKETIDAEGQMFPILDGDNIILAGGDRNGGFDYFDTQTCDITHIELGFDGFASALYFQVGRKVIFYNLAGVNLLITQMIVYDLDTQTHYTDQYPGGNVNLKMQYAFMEGSDLVFINGNVGTNFNTYDIGTQTWGTKPSRFNRRATTNIDVGDKIFFLGGRTGSSVWSDKADVYDKNSGIWTSFTLSEPKDKLSVTANGNSLIVAGGENSTVNATRSTDLVEIIDMSDLSITTLQLPRKGSGFAAVSVNDKVIFAGGNRTEAYVIDMTDQTLVTQDLGASFALENLRGATFNDLAVFAGGNGADGDGDVVSFYDDLTETWDTIQLGLPREKVAFIEHDSKLYICGGEDFNFDFQDVLIFDAASFIDASLPVDIVSLSAVREGKVIEARLAVENQIDVDSYTLERSTDGSAFSFVTALPAVDEKTVYQFKDTQGINTSEVYYRVRVTDLDGSVAFSHIVTVAPLSELTAPRVSPNPFTGNVNLDLSNFEGEELFLSVTDLTGRRLLSQRVVAQTSAVLDLQRLTDGVYILLIANEKGELFTERLVKRR